MQYDDLNMPVITLIGLLGAILTAAVIIGLQALYYNYEDHLYQAKVIDTRYVEAESALAEQEAKIKRYAWIDQEQGVVSVSIDQAKDLVCRELRAEQVREESSNDQ